MRPSRHPAAPVTVTTPDGQSHVVSAHDFRHGVPPLPENADAESPTPEGAVTLELMEEWVMRTLVHVMRSSPKLSERTAAATAATKLLGIKYRVGPDFGGGLDNNDAE